MRAIGAAKGTDVRGRIGAVEVGRKRSARTAGPGQPLAEPGLKGVEVDDARVLGGDLAVHPVAVQAAGESELVNGERCQRSVAIVQTTNNPIILTTLKNKGDTEIQNCDSNLAYLSATTASQAL